MATLSAEPIRSDQHESIITFLSAIPGTRKPHSGGTLFDHLVGVYQILANWGCEVSVCHAGLFHSIYGTDSFSQETLSIRDRPLLARTIGDAAEKLAYAFSTMNTRSFLNEICFDLSVAAGACLDGDRYTASEKNELLQIYLANWLQQAPRFTQRQKFANEVILKEVCVLMNDRISRDILSELSNNKDALSHREAVISHWDLDKVNIFDNVIDLGLQEDISKLMEKNIWRYGWKAAEAQQSHSFWHSHFAGGDEHSGVSCEIGLEERPLIDPILRLWRYIKSNIAPSHIPIRVYANGHTFGVDGFPHTDSTEVGRYSFIYYAHRDWRPSWGGETVFFDPSGRDVIRAIMPLPGRLICFPGNILHAARSPSRDCPSLRSVVVLKTIDAASNA